MSLGLISLTLPANSLAQILDRNGQPVRLYISATGGLLSDIGQTQVRSNGALSVYVEDGNSYIVKVYEAGSSKLLRTIPGVDPLSDAGDTGNLPPVAGGEISAWAANLDTLIVGAITRDGNDAATSASVEWPDGATGFYTATTVSAAFPGAVDAYTVTHSLNGQTLTATQPAVTRNANGAVTVRPDIVVA